jgi:hypothetical protein
MPAIACPRCQRTNPAEADYCYWDGSALKGGAAAPALAGLPHAFIFPSGRRCQSYDELALGCQEEWAPARDLLKQGVFRQYFTSIGRMDLAKSADEAAGQANPDMGLTQLVGSLPTTEAHVGPKLDLQPRRLVLGNLFAGETKQFPLKVTNQGKGTLQGTLSITEGNNWLKVGGANNGQLAVQTTKEQQISIQVDTRGLAAAQSYGGKLTVVTNGGVVEVPAKVDVAAHPFPRAPFQGARTPREMAEKMRDNAKLAVPLLETGELSKWFSGNGWKYPVDGTPAKGVAGVQQFFEAMGLAKPPKVQLSQNDLPLTYVPGERARGQLSLRTSAKKWVYGNVTTDTPWLKVLTPSVSGPQQAAVGFEVNPAQLPRGRAHEGTFRVVANNGQILTGRVLVRVQALPGAALRDLLQPILILAGTLLLLRLLLIPAVELHAMPRATRVAADQLLVPDKLPPRSPAHEMSNWLSLPWSKLFLFGSGQLPEGFLGTDEEETPNAAVMNARLRKTESDPGDVLRFRDTFVGRFLRIFIGWTFWVGAALWAFYLWRKGGMKELPWGIVSGLVMGVLASATLACLVLVFDLVPHLIWDFTFQSGSAVLVPVWLLLTLVCWALIGAALGLVLRLLGPLGRAALTPVQQFTAGLCRLCGLGGLADKCLPA